MAGSLFLAGMAHAQTLSIGVAAPLSGTSALLGQQIESGARLAASAAGAEITVVDDACTAEGGADAARAFAQAKVQVVVGFLCTEAIEAALPLLKDAAIPVITVGVRTESLTDRRARTGWPVFRLAATTSATLRPPSSLACGKTSCSPSLTTAPFTGVKWRKRSAPLPNRRHSSRYS